MSLPQRLLGSTGFSVSTLGFGVSGPLGGAGVSASMVDRLVREALDGGVTLFDTAPFYGESEQRLGKALRGAANVLVTTKAGKRRRGLRLEHAERPEEILASIEASRTALRRDRLDLLLLHGPTHEGLTTAVRDALDDAQRRGWIGAYGATARSGTSALITSGFGSVLQIPTESAEAPSAAEAGAGLIGIEAMRRAASGVRLSLAPADLWYTVRALKNGPAPTEESPLNLLEMALRTPGFACILMTTTRPAHLHANIEVAGRVGF